MSQTSSRPPATEPRSRLTGPAITILLAAVAPLVVWAVSVPLMDVDLAVKMAQDQPTQKVVPVSILVAAIVISLLAWGLLALLTRVRGSAESTRRLWCIIAVVVLLISLISPLTMAVGVGAKLTLCAMHVVVGAVLLVRFGRAPSGAPSA